MLGLFVEQSIFIWESRSRVLLWRSHEAVAETPDLDLKPQNLDLLSKLTRFGLAHLRRRTEIFRLRVA
jgi:hypothetical protein